MPATATVGWVIGQVRAGAAAYHIAGVTAMRLDTGVDGATGIPAAPTVRTVSVHIRAGAVTSRLARATADSAGTIVAQTLIVVRARTSALLSHTGANACAVFSRSAGSRGRNVARTVAARSCGLVAEVVAAASRLAA